MKKFCGACGNEQAITSLNTLAGMAVERLSCGAVFYSNDAGSLWANFDNHKDAA